MASAGQLGITRIQPDVSINELGIVALIGWLEDTTEGDEWENIFVGNGDERPLINISPAITAQYDPVVGPPVQINRLNWACDRRVQFVPTPFGPEPESAVEIWNANSVNDNILLVVAQPFLAEFDGIYANPSVNNLNGIVFTAFEGSTNYLATLTSSGAFKVELNAEVPNPMIADDNHFVMRIGDATGRIAVLPPAFFPFVTIADDPNFNLTGKRPGISNDGTNVGFYGNLTGTGASALGIEAGPGVFAAMIAPGGAVSTLKVSEGMEPSSLVADSRVAITDTFEGTFVVTYLGAQPGGNFGLFSTVVEDISDGVGPPVYQVGEPMPVAVVGDVIDGVTVQSVQAGYDGLALAERDFDGSVRVQNPGDHRVCFFANTSGGEKVFRGAYFKNDKVVAVEGGIRARTKLDPALTSPTPEVFVFIDENGDGEPSTGESIVAADDVSVYEDQVYFTPPPYAPSLWPPVPPEGQYAGLLISNPSGIQVVCDFMKYTEDPVEGVIAVREGFKTRIEEAFESDEECAPLFPFMAQQAGAKAETILHGVLRRTEPGDGAINGELTAVLEPLPIRLRDFINETRPANFNKTAVVRPITFGQTGHTIVEHFDDTVIMTLATGTLTYTQSGADCDAPPPEIPGGEVSGGGFLFSSDLSGPQTVLGANGWRFDYELHPDIGVRLLNVRTIIGGDDEAVAEQISVPSVVVNGPGGETALDLEERYFSHLYLNGDVFAQFPSPEGHPYGRHDDGEGLSEWILSAMFRLQLDGSEIEENQEKYSISARQTYAFTVPHTDVEPTHCVYGASVFPRVSWSFSDVGTETLPETVRFDHRMSFHPQDGLEPPEYIVGIAKDIDDPKWVIPFFPGANPICQPVPIWTNAFECLGPEGTNTTMPVERSLLFDTRYEDATYPTGDNVHIHHRHSIGSTPWGFFGDPNERIFEAPGSFDGSVHLHWRWGAALAEGFGSGYKLLPDNQEWILGLVDSEGFPDDFDDLTAVVPIGFDIRWKKPTLLVGCEQSAIQANRQYETFSTGFGYAVNEADGPRCAIVRLVAEEGPLDYYTLSRFFCGTVEFPFGYEMDGVAFWDWVLSWIRAFAEGTADYGPTWPIDLKALANVFIGLGVVPAESCGPPAPLSGSARNGGEAICDVLTYPAELNGMATPFDLSLGSRNVSITSDPPGAFRVGPSGMTTTLLKALVEDTGFPGGSVMFDFDTPAQALVELSVALNDHGAETDVEVDFVNGGSLVETAIVPTSSLDEGRISEGTLTVSPSGPFDQMVVRSSDSSFELAVSGFAVCDAEILPGDINLDGLLDLVDLDAIGGCYTGEGGVTPFWCARADLNTDGSVDCDDVAIFDDLSGGVYSLQADCNGNGTIDGCDIASGVSDDVNANGIPDECEGNSGACCDSSGDCALTTAEECADPGSTYQGDGVLCDPDPCGPELGYYRVSSTPGGATVLIDGAGTGATTPAIVAVEPGNHCVGLVLAGHGGCYSRGEPCPPVFSYEVASGDTADVACAFTQSSIVAVGTYSMEGAPSPRWSESSDQVLVTLVVSLEAGIVTRENLDPSRVFFSTGHAPDVDIEHPDDDLPNAGQTISFRVAVSAAALGQALDSTDDRMWIGLRNGDWLVATARSDGSPPQTPRGIDQVVAWPNPFSSNVELSWRSGQVTPIALEIFEVGGRRVRSLSSSIDAGRHRVSWDGRDESGQRLPAGVYYYTIEAAGHRFVGKVSLVR